MSPSSDVPSVLAVCTGNICRSPAVERLLAQHLAGAATVFSAGTGALVGAPISPPMASLVEAAGGDASGFAARQLTRDVVRSADLVLALTRAHRSAVVRLEPAALRRTFTLRELARLLSLTTLEDLPAEPLPRLLDVIARAQASRAAPGALLAPDGASDDDVDDPYGGDAARYGRSWAQLSPAVAVVAAALGGVAVGS